MNLFVGNLHRSISAEELRKIFAEFGEVIDVNLVTDAAGNSLGRANVFLVPDKAGREAILELDLVPIKGKPVRVRQCIFRDDGERRGSRFAWAGAERRRRFDRRHLSEPHRPHAA